MSAVLAEAPVLAADRTVAVRFGELRAATGRVPTNDLWIAATALAHGLTLLTADVNQAALPLVHRPHPLSVRRMGVREERRSISSTASEVTAYLPLWTRSVDVV